jgi:two-component system chemotaxis response regulator CheB
MNAAKKIKVLVVDDCAVMQRVIRKVLSRDPGIEVVGTAGDPYEARDKILELNPDVLTLDLQMPRMDGLSFIKVLQQYRTLPVVVISSFTQQGSETALAALEAGAVEVLAKPIAPSQLADTIKAAAAAGRPVRPLRSGPVPRPAQFTGGLDARQIILIGSSTGGIEALREMLPQLPDGLPPICITQHIPPNFSKAVADRLNKLCAFEVREAVDWDELHPGLALVAPGDYHMIVGWESGRYHVRLTQSPPLHHCRPAVDALFSSAARHAGHHAIAVILTGMGRDGAMGMRDLKNAGAHTIAQDEPTCVVYGMPRAAVELGVVDRVAPLPKIPAAILQSLNAHLASNPHAQKTTVPPPLERRRLATKP